MRMKCNQCDMIVTYTHDAENDCATCGRKYSDKEEINAKTEAVTSPDRNSSLAEHTE